MVRCWQEGHFDGTAKERPVGLRLSSQANGGACRLAQLEMAGEKIGVQVSEDDVLDAKVVLLGKLQIDADVPLRVDDHRATGSFVRDQVGRVSQALEVELLEDHAVILTSRTPAVESPDSGVGLQAGVRAAGRHRAHRWAGSTRRLCDTLNDLIHFISGDGMKRVVAIVAVVLMNALALDAQQRRPASPEGTASAQVDGRWKQQA